MRGRPGADWAHWPPGGTPATSSDSRTNLAFVMIDGHTLTCARALLVTTCDDWAEVGWGGVG